MTETITDLLAGPPKIVTCGVELFEETLATQGVDAVHVDWRPPVGDAGALARVLGDPRHADANATALERITAATPHWTGVTTAREALGLEVGQFLHAGPPLTWERASGPMRGALIGAMLYEGMADTPEQAVAIAERGDLELSPCHHHATVGPMAGVVSPSMPLHVIENTAFGNRAYCTLNEGLGKVLRYGAYAPEVVERLRWMQDVLGPAMGDAIAVHGPLDLRALISQALQMGDELHNRNRAATSLFVREMIPALLDTGRQVAELAEVARFVNGNDHYFLNLVMPAAKSATDPARDIPGSSVVVAMARNGTDFGIQISGTGDAWFTGPAQVPDGLFLGDYTVEDANPDIGDSTITENVRGRRVRDGGRPGDRPVRRRRGRRRARGDPDHVRDHAGGAPRLPDPDPGVPRHPRRHRRGQGRALRARALREHRDRREGARRRPGRRGARDPTDGGVHGGGRRARRAGARSHARRRMSTDPVLVTGAAGKTGRAVIAALRARGAPVRALVHRAEQTGVVREAGADEVVVGDQRDVTTLTDALSGTACVYAIAPNMHPDEVAMGEALVAACRRAGVGRLVYHSVINPHASAMPHHHDKLTVEEHLLESGLVPTVLRPNAYHENVLGYLDEMLATGRYTVPYGVTRPLWSVALDDVAVLAARVCTEDGHAHATYDLSGPDGVTAADVARTVGMLTGRPVLARPLAPDDWADERGLTGETRRRLTAMAAHYDAHGSPGNPRVLRCLLDRVPTGFADWARTHLADRRASDVAGVATRSPEVSVKVDDE